MLDPFLHFRSGTNHAAEIRGTYRAGFQVGVSAPELFAPALEELERWAEDCKGKRLAFVDTGAFGQVDRQLRIAKRFTPKQWGVIHDRQEAVALAWGRGSFHVAPDMPGHQQETLDLLHRYAERMLALTELGANVIVPLVPGPIPMGDFAGMACDQLGFNRLELVWGIPARKNATKWQDLCYFAHQVRDHLNHPLPRFHLLGISPDPWGPPDHARGKHVPGLWPGDDFLNYLRAIRTPLPMAYVSCDSVRIVALKGLTNGRGGQPRALTQAEIDCRAEGLQSVDEIKEESVRRVFGAEQLRRTRWFIDSERMLRATSKQRKVHAGQQALFREDP